MTSLILAWGPTLHSNRRLQGGWGDRWPPLRQAVQSPMVVTFQTPPEAGWDRNQLTRWTKTGDLEKKSQMEIWFAPWFFERRRILWWYDGYGEGIGQIQPEQRKHMMMFSQCKSILLANCLNTSLHEQYACKLSKQKLTLSVYNTTQQAGIPLYRFIM